MDEDASWALSTLSTSDDANEDFPRRPRDLHQTRRSTRGIVRARAAACCGRLMGAATAHCALGAALLGHWQPPSVAFVSSAASAYCIFYPIYDYAVGVPA